MIRQDARAFRLAAWGKQRSELIAARDRAAHLLQCQKVHELEQRIYAVTHAILAEGKA